MQTSTENPDVNATANPPATIKRHFEVVVNFADTDRVGDCLLELNIKGFLYTNSIEPIDAEETTVVSGTISGTVELAADEDDKDAIDKAFDLVGPLVEPFGGESIECRLVDRQATPAPHTGDTGSGLTPPPF